MNPRLGAGPERSPGAHGGIASRACVRRESSSTSPRVEFKLSSTLAPREARRHREVDDVESARIHRDDRADGERAARLRPPSPGAPRVPPGRPRRIPHDAPARLRARRAQARARARGLRGRRPRVAQLAPTGTAPSTMTGPRPRRRRSPRTTWVASTTRSLADLARRGRGRVHRGRQTRRLPRHHPGRHDQVQAQLHLRGRQAVGSDGPGRRGVSKPSIVMRGAKLYAAGTAGEAHRVPPRGPRPEPSGRRRRRRRPRARRGAASS